MSDPKSRPPIPPPGKPANPAGQVRHDKSGKAIWEWAVDTGRHALDSTSRLLKKLELPGLALEDDAKRKKASEPEPQPAGGRQVPTYGGPREDDPLAGSRRGFNPYDTRQVTPRKTTPPAGVASRRATPAPAPAEKPGLFASLFGSKR